MSEEDKTKTKGKKARRKPTDLGRHDMENIRFLGDNCYTVAVKRRVNGRLVTRRARRVKGKQNAINTRNKFIQELSLLQYSKGVTKEPKWKDARKGYVEYLNKRRTIGEIGSGEVNKAESYLKHTKPWDDMWASQITEEMVLEIKLGRLGSEHMKPAARKDYLRMVKGVFKWLQKNHKIFVNPAADIYMRRVRRKRVAWIRQELMDEIIAYTHDKKMVPNTPWAPVFFLAYYSGLRSGELYALKWEDVDFKENMIYVRRSYDWKAKELKRPKSGQARMVDISADELRNYLLAHKERNFKKESVYVFSRSNEWEKGKAARAVKAVLQDIGYSPRKDEDDENIWPNFHSFRASYTMNLLLKDTAVLKVQKSLGHLDLKTTMHYLGELDLQDIRGTSLVLFEDGKKKKKLKAV